MSRHASRPMTASGTRFGEYEIDSLVGVGGMGKVYRAAAADGTPEQIRGEPVTGAADTYSLGCVAFECVQGRPPFADHEGMRVLWAHLQDEPPDLSAQRTDITPDFAQALKTALRNQHR